MKDMIRKTNKEGYNRLADVFIDEKRVTTANFHELSQDFFRYILSSKIKDGMKVLEVGAGRGWLRNTFTWPDIDYIAVDIAENMVKDASDSIVSTAEDLPFDDNCFDCVVSSLGDPFFYEESIKEISRVLKEGGLFVLSTPAKEWAKSLRGDSLFSTFVEKGEVIQTYSFTYDEIEMREIWGKCGFLPITIQNWYSNGIKGVISKDIGDIDDKMKSGKIAILTTAIFIKKGEAYQQVPTKGIRNE